MMYGHWFGNGYCPLWRGYSPFNIWTIVLTVAVIIVFIGVFVIQKKKRSNNTDVIEILKMEYVKGNITEEEYLNRKRVIEGK